MGVLNPMIIFLRQEIHRIDRVIRTVRNSLNDLQLAIDGIIILNDVREKTVMQRRGELFLLVIATNS